MIRMNRVKISVVIPIYNVEKYLAACLDSLMIQSLNNIEIILVNDASTDKSEEIALRFCQMDNRFKYVLNQISKGPGGARNKGLELATGEYIFFLDSDDKVTKTGLEKIYNIAKENNYDIVFGKPVWEIQENKHKPTYSEYLFIKGDRVLSEEEYCDISIITSQLIKRDLFVKNNIRFSENVTAEDVEMALKLQNIMNSMYITNELVYLRTERQDENNKSITQQFNINIIEDRLKIIEKMLRIDIKRCSNFNRYIKIIINLNFIKDRIYIIKHDDRLLDDICNSFESFMSNNSQYSKFINKCFKQVFNTSVEQFMNNKIYFLTTEKIKSTNLFIKIIDKIKFKVNKFNINRKYGVK